jgi:hydroxyethylthiazole kinase-like sugar kinase family protein
MPAASTWATSVAIGGSTATGCAATGTVVGTVTGTGTVVGTVTGTVVGTEVDEVVGVATAALAGMGAVAVPCAPHVPGAPHVRVLDVLQARSGLEDDVAGARCTLKAKTAEIVRIEARERARKRRPRRLTNEAVRLALSTMC